MKEGYWGKIAKVAAHFAFWAMFFSLPFLLRPEVPMPDREFRLHAGEHEPIEWGYVVSSLMVVGMFYLNAHFVFHLTLKKNMYGWLALCQFSMVALLLLVFNLIVTLELPVLTAHVPRIFPFFSYSVTAIMALSYHFIMERTKMERLTAEREREYLKAELQFLRWQISPHFLFNVLNNMAALSRLKPEQLEPIVIRLSGLMRYMLYDTDGKKVSLTKEIEYLQNYLALQTLRFGDKIKLSFRESVDTTLQFEIETMLLIPFVENAFKHGISGVDEPYINIFISLATNVAKERVLILEVSNKFVAGAGTEDTSGIGLSNVKRRLKLLYADKAEIFIDQRDGIYTVILQVIN